MQHIFVQDNCFLFDEVKHGQVSCENEYLNEALLFCKQWLNGKATFEFSTSGSTGIPVSHTAMREHMLYSAKATINALNLTNNEHVFACINTKMIGGAMLLVRALELGCDITIVNPVSNPLELLKEEHNYTLASFVPMQIFDGHDNYLWQQKLNKFKNILLGGAPANQSTLNYLANLNCSVWQTYGMTETLSHIALKQLGVDEHYITLPGTKIKTDERNCLCLQAEVTDNQWLYTNDVVQLFNHNQFEILGRIDDVINTGGVKVFCYDVEQVVQQKLNELDIANTHFFVGGTPHPKYGQAIVAVLLSNPIAKPLLDEITAHCKAVLGKHAAPKQYFFTTMFEKTNSGKINKQATLDKLLLA